jgi:hypothetical protein
VGTVDGDNHSSHGGMRQLLEVRGCATDRRRGGGGARGARGVSTGTVATMPCGSYMRPPLPVCPPSRVSCARGEGAPVGQEASRVASDACVPSKY